MASPVTILLLEDSDLDAEFVEERLARAGLAVAIDRASDRKGFTARLTAAAYDVILSDYHVPTFEGFAALELARQLQPDTPFIFVSGMMGEELAVDALKQGATDYVLKQRLARLPAAVERALAERRERTERKQAEQLATTILENMGEGFIILDEQWRHTYVNAAAERATGQTRKEILGKDHWELYPATVGTRLEEVYRRVMSERVTVGFEHHYAPWDRWYAIKASPAPVGGGVWVQFREVTDAKRAEQQLRASEERFRAIFDQTTAGVAEVDLAGRFVRVNARYCEIVGRAVDELSALRLQDITHPDDRTDGVRRFEALTRGGPPFEGERRILRPDGSVVWVSDSVSLIRDGAGEPRSAVAVSLDITDRRQGEEALKASEARFRAIADSAPVLIWQTDERGAVFVNREYTAFTGRSFAELRGMGWASAIHPDDADEYIGKYLAAYRRRERFEAQLRLRRHDGEHRWLKAVGLPHHGPGGEFLGYIGSSFDITDIKRAEESLKASEAWFRTLADASPAILWVTDPAGRCTFLSRGWYEFTGQTEEQGLGLGWLDATHPDDKVHSRALFVAANARQEPFAIDYRIRRADGEYRRAIDAGRPRFSPTGEYLGYVGLVLDVTARRRAEEALRVSEERFAFVRRTSGVGFWYCDLPFDVLEWDEQVKAHFHFPRTASVTIDMFYDRLHPDDREPTRQAIERSIAEKSHYDVDYRTVDPATGAEKWVRAIGRTLYAEDGTPIQFDGVTLDITDRKRAEADRQFFVSLAENSTEFIGMYDLDGGPFFVNEAGRRLVGLGGPEEAVRVPVREFFFPEDQPFIVDDFLPRVLRDGRGEVEVRFRHFQTGEARWMIYNMFTVRVPDYRQARLATVSRDITERKRAEENLARLLAAEKRNAALLERVAGASRAVNAVLSADSIARILTEEARAILGARVASTTFTTETGGAQEVHAAAVDRHRDAAADPGPALDVALALRVCAANRPVRVPAHAGDPARRGRLAVPLVGHGGKNLGVVQLADKGADDFTAEDEAVLVQLAAIAAVGIENARLYERLQEQDRRKDEFLATLAHELRNPLAPLRNGLEVMRLAAAGGATAVRVREMMERQVGHMVRLIDDLLDVSRITRGRVELQLQRVDVQAVMAAALEVSRPLIDAGRHELRVSAPAEPLPLDADPTRLAQVLSNLLNNAAKYTPEGGRIELSAARDGGDAVIRVRDNGAGIDPDMLPRVFELFTQVGRTLDRAQGGLGIGLALVKRLAEMHGGSITAESAGEGRGSTFVVRLPLVRDPEPGRPSGADAAESVISPAGRWRVLVVDDNVDAAESLALLLTAAGHTTATAHSGPDAITAAQAFAPEVVFLDIGLPGMNGYEVAMRLRGSADLGGVVLVALTGWGTDDDQKRANEAGFDHHLTKPVATAAVHALLARLPALAR